MPNSVILVDFGASRIKAVHWDLAEGRLISSRECAAPVLNRGPRGEAEGDPEHYWRALEMTAGHLAAADSNVGDMWICSEMHGFILTDPKVNQPRTPYISWQDQRASYSSGQARSKLDELQALVLPLMQEGGIRLRSGLPITNLAAMQGDVRYLGPSRFLTLVDWLLIKGGEAKPHCHPTLAAGTGLYSLADKAWSIPLMKLAGIDPDSLLMPVIQKKNGPIGTIQLSGRPIRVWGGLGDLQAAAHGMGFPKESSILINLGTGSQVLAMVPNRSENVEIRPCAEGQLAHAITHIPSGRAMNTFASFIDECARTGGGQSVFWQFFSELDADEVLAAEACVDLNVFSAAWRYRSGGSIAHISESSFSMRWVMNALVKSWLTQYAQALATIATHHSSDTFLLGGGLSRRGAFIPRVLESLLGKRSLEMALRTGEETLDGLLKLAEASF